MYIQSLRLIALPLILKYLKPTRMLTNIINLRYKFCFKERADLFWEIYSVQSSYKVFATNLESNTQAPEFLRYIPSHCPAWTLALDIWLACRHRQRPRCSHLRPCTEHCFGAAHTCRSKSSKYDSTIVNLYCWPQTKLSYRRRTWGSSM